VRAMTVRIKISILYAHGNAAGLYTNKVPQKSIGTSVIDFKSSRNKEVSIQDVAS